MVTITSWLTYGRYILSNNLNNSTVLYFCIHSDMDQINVSLTSSTLRLESVGIGVVYKFTVTHATTSTKYSTILFNSSQFHSAELPSCLQIMTFRKGNNCVKVERKALKSPKTLKDVIWIFTEAIMVLCYTEKRCILNLPRAIAHAVLDEVVSQFLSINLCWGSFKTLFSMKEVLLVNMQGKKTIASECREKSDCVELKGPQILKELYELQRMLTFAKLFGCRKRSPAFLFAAGFEYDDVLERKRTSRVRFNQY